MQHKDDLVVWADCRSSIRKGQLHVWINQIRNQSNLVAGTTDSKLLCGSNYFAKASVTVGEQPAAVFFFFFSVLELYINTCLVYSHKLRTKVLHTWDNAILIAWIGDIVALWCVTACCITRASFIFNMRFPDVLNQQAILIFLRIGGLHLAAFFSGNADLGSISEAMGIFENRNWTPKKMLLRIVFSTINITFFLCSFWFLKWGLD